MGTVGTAVVFGLTTSGESVAPSDADADTDTDTDSRREPGPVTGRKAIIANFLYFPYL